MEFTRTPMNEIRNLPRVGADTVRRLGVHAWDSLKCRGASAREFFIVERWSRDCDHCESTNLTAIPATRRHYDDLLRNMEASAEGPWSVTVLRPQDVEGYQPVHRDHVLEAYEDGHPWSVAM